MMFQVLKVFYIKFVCIDNINGTIIYQLHREVWTEKKKNNDNST